MPKFLTVPNDWPDTTGNRAGLRAVVAWYQRLSPAERSHVAAEVGDD